MAGDEVPVRGHQQGFYESEVFIGRDDK